MSAVHLDMPALVQAISEARAVHPEDAIAYAEFATRRYFEIIGA